MRLPAVQDNLKDPPSVERRKNTSSARWGHIRQASEIFRIKNLTICDFSASVYGESLFIIVKKTANRMLVASAELCVSRKKQEATDCVDTLAPSPNRQVTDADSLQRRRPG